MNTVKMTVTPGMAAEWLASANTSNRSISKPRVDSYAADMDEGNWYYTHQGIAFYEGGELADGQHRLAAVVKHGKPVEFLVTFGLSKMDAAGIDVHRSRSTNDVIRIAGLADWIGKDEPAIAKVIRRAGGLAGAPTARHVAEFCNRNKDALLFVANAMPTAVRFLSAAPVKAGIMCAYGHVDTGRLSEFCAALLSGIISGPDDVAVIRLRERLMASGKEMQSGEPGRMLCLKLTMRAISAYCGRERIQRLMEPKGFVYPLPNFIDNASEAKQ